MQRVRELKGWGDAGIQCGNNRDAYKAYTQALEILEHKKEVDSEESMSGPLHTQEHQIEALEKSLLSNRSLAYSRASRWAAASADAIQLTTRWPTWAKGWLRSARACEGQGSHAVAAQHYAHAWQLLGKDPEGTGQQDCLRALWRSLNRLTRPQIANELIKLVGMGHSGVEGQLQIRAASPLLAICSDHSHQEDAPRPAGQQDQQPIQEEKQQQLLQHDYDQQQQLREEQQLAEDSPPSEAELAEAGFQLVCELVAGSFSPSFLHCFMGWMQQGSMAEHERAMLRAMLYLKMQRPHAAAHAAACAVKLCGGLLLKGPPLSEETVDQLSRAFHLHGRAMLLSTATFARVNPNSSKDGSLAQQPHAIVVDAAQYKASLRSLFCATLLSPRNHAYSSSVSSEDVHLLGGDALREAAAAAKEQLHQLAQGNRAAAAVPSCFAARLASAAAAAAAATATATPKASPAPAPAPGAPGVCKSMGPKESCSLGSIRGQTENGSSATSTQFPLKLGVEVHLPCRVLPAAARSLLMQQVKLLIPKALEAVVHEHQGNAQEPSRSHARPSAQPLPPMHVSVALEGIANGRCPGDHAAVQLEVCAEVCMEVVQELLSGSACPVNSILTFSSNPGRNSSSSCHWQVGVDALHAGLAASTELAQLAGAAPCKTLWRLRPPPRQTPKQEQQWAGRETSDSSGRSMESGKAEEHGDRSEVKGGLRQQQQEQKEEAQQQQQQQKEEEEDGENQSQLLARTTSSLPLVPLPKQRGPAKELPYAHYRLVDALGNAVERPQKHPFALSRVYYSANEVPAAERQVWYEPADGCCRWRQTASEVIIIANQVPQGTRARDLQVNIQPHSLEVILHRTGEVVLSGQLARGVVPSECTWDCGGGLGEDGCIIELAKMNLELYAQSWRHAEAMWPRLFTHHADVAWDDAHKDYTDLPLQIMAAQGAEAQKKEQQNALEACERRQLQAADDREDSRRRAREQHLQALLCRQR